MRTNDLEKGNKVPFIKNIFNKNLHTLIFFITSRCNSRCMGCFNWKNLNQSNDLNLSEIEKISKNMPIFKHVLFSGGEPLLRSDLPEICAIFRKNNHVESVSIPSNGLMPDRYQETIEKILIKNPGLVVGVHFSLDGLKETHDMLRGIKGNFENLVESVKRINSLRKKYPLLNVTINSVISDKNYRELDKLIKFVKSLKVDSHTFDLLRGSIKPTADIQLPPIEEIKKINKLRMETKRYYLRNVTFWHRLFSLSKEYYLIQSQMKVLNGGKIPFDCLAGEVAVVINHDGKLGLCELVPFVGDLRKENYNFGKIWNGRKARQQRESIKNHQCDCTHICFLSMAIDHSPSTVFFKMPFRYFLKNE